MTFIARREIKIAPDLSNFLREVREHRGLFSAGEVFVARAPGRLDVMGGIADYSGSLVLEMPIADAAFAAVQRTDERSIRIVSRGRNQVGSSEFSMQFRDLFRGGRPIEYGEARQYFHRDRPRRWAGYVAGAFLVLMRERGVRFQGGAKILISSNVPSGKGVSSSAAFEVAAMKALAAAFGVEISGRDLAIECQKVENLVVGAPCGVMDQMTSSLGSSGRLMSMRCQPAEVLDSLAIPNQLELRGIDSGLRHSVGTGDYGSVRIGAFMGYRMIAEAAGLRVRQVSNGAVEIDDDVWGGYLANIEPIQFEERFASKLPKTILGSEFLARFGGITDRVTAVVPDREYAVYYPTRHPIYENERVGQFAERLRDDEPDGAALGELMYASHQSYSDCGLGSDGTDFLVDLVRSSPNLLGAKITGGGSGGTVAVLGRRGATAEVQRIANEYKQRTGRRAHIFSGSSIGAEEFGVTSFTLA